MRSSLTPATGSMLPRSASWVARSASSFGFGTPKACRALSMQPLMALGRLSSTVPGPGVISANSGRGHLTGERALRTALGAAGDDRRAYHVQRVRDPSLPHHVGARGNAGDGG